MNKRQTENVEGHKFSGFRVMSLLSLYVSSDSSHVLMEKKKAYLL